METLELNGLWQVCQEGTSESIPAQVPGCIHTDLLVAGRIPDPFYRDNELAQQWIGETNWRYSRVFTVLASLLQHDRVVLRCDGLDTLAEVWLNGVSLGRCDNMFRSWEFAVKPLLREGDNHLEVRFESVVPYVQEKNAAHPLVAPHNVPYEVLGRSYVRKVQANFGWDWGPSLITCGIWRPITLCAYQTARLRDIHVLQDHTQAGIVGLIVKVQVEEFSALPLSVDVTISRHGEALAESAIPLLGGAGQAHLIITDPQLWWPLGLGGQPLYQVQVTLRSADATLETDTKRIGLRTLTLDRHPDQWGESFQFTANGVPFFAKGGNWIPGDAFITRMDATRYRDLLQSCAHANMNMIRVWGGGTFEDDTFYDICDELGLCVWQDFLFACAAYPVSDPAFIANVSAEAEDNIRRLRHHASLTLWCGNNEVEMCGMAGNITERSDLMQWQDYRALFDELLPGIVQRLDPEHDYWPSSPHTPGANRQDSNDPTRGDAHLWAVWHDRQPFEWYRGCAHRFNSEFGFQSFPEPLTVQGYTVEEDRNVTSRVMEHHQRCGIGNAVIMQYLLEWFRLPPQFDMILWLSQILQGMGMKYAVEHWRRSMPRGMGTLYWQINDNWPVASWSSIDYHARWKALHYMARRFYAPVLVSAVEDVHTGRVEIFLTNDERAARAGDVVWTLYDLAGGIRASGQFAARIAAQSSAVVQTLELGVHLHNGGAWQVVLEIAYISDGCRISSNLTHFARPKHLCLQDPEITLALEPRDKHRCMVTLTARKPALWCWLALPGTDIRCADNFLHLMPSHPERILVTAGVELSADDWRALQVYHLRDTYHP